MSVKKELSLKERRKIFEESVGLIKSIYSMSDMTTQSKVCDRQLKNLSEKQLSKCHSILAATLRCEGSITMEGDTKIAVLVNKTSGIIIEKEKFNNLLNSLPGNKMLKETIWKSLVKGDKKAIQKLSEVI